MRKCTFSSFSANEPAINCRGGCNRSPPFPLYRQPVEINSSLLKEQHMSTKKEKKERQ